MYTISMPFQRTEENRKQCERDRREAAKKPLVKDEIRFFIVMTFLSFFRREGKALPLRSAY